MTVMPDRTTLPSVVDRADTLAADLRRLATDGGAPSVRDLVDLAAVTAGITVALLESALPAADDDQPGTGEAFERAAELGDDARRHLVTALHLIAGAYGIASVRPPAT